MMYEEKIALMKEQIAALQKDAANRKPKNIYLVGCGGSLATLYPAKYIIERETVHATTNAYSANEFFHDPPARLGKESLVVLNSQSGSTKETVAAAKLAKERGAMTVAFTGTVGSMLAETVDNPVYYYDNPVNPYPAILSIYPEVYLMTAALLDALDGTQHYAEMEQAMDVFEKVDRKIVEEYREPAREFGLKYRGEPIIYTISSGLDLSSGYVLTNCSFMECLWIHSSPLHAGEFFHGAFEAVDESTAVFAFLGIGRTRPVEERAVVFLRRHTPKLTVIDAARFDLSELPEWTRPYVATLYLGDVAGSFCGELSRVKGQPMSSRRYMGVEKY